MYVDVDDVDATPRYLELSPISLGFHPYFQSFLLG